VIGPGGRENQIDRVVSVDVSRFDQQAAHGPDNPNGLPARCRKLKLNPVICAGRLACPGVNARYVGAKVAVKILNRKLWARSDRSNRCTILNLTPCCRGAANQGEEHQQTKRPKSIPSCRKPIP
jgi:hypothetical protein